MENLEELKLLLEIVAILIAWSESFPVFAVIAGLGMLYLLFNGKGKKSDRR